MELIADKVVVDRKLSRGLPALRSSVQLETEAWKSKLERIIALVTSVASCSFLIMIVDLLIDQQMFHSTFSHILLIINFL